MKIRKKAILMVLVVFCLNFTAFAQKHKPEFKQCDSKEKAMETLKEEKRLLFCFCFRRYRHPKKSFV